MAFFFKQSDVPPKTPSCLIIEQFECKLKTYRIKLSIKKVYKSPYIEYMCTYPIS